MATAELFAAVGAQNSVRVQALLNAKADANGYRDGWALLHYAASLSCASTVVVLLVARADPNARTEAIGWTALHYAAHFDQRANVRILWAHTLLDRDAADWTGKCAAQYARDSDEQSSGCRGCDCPAAWVSEWRHHGRPRQRGAWAETLEFGNS